MWYTKNIYKDLKFQVTINVIDTHKNKKYNKLIAF